MSQAERKIAQYLNEAHSTEHELVRTLQAQIAMTPHGRHRNGLEAHLEQTRSHASKVRERLRELDGSSNPLLWGIGLIESAVGQALALGQAPLQLVRGGTSGEEKVLKNAKDACASEALEIATYTALERAANAVGDEQTARLAASILSEEQMMLDRLLRELPALAQAAIDAAVRGKHSYELGETGAADAAREVGKSAKRTARRGEAGARRTARRTRKVPGVARVEGEVKGAISSQGDLAIADYDGLTTEEIVERLPALSQIDLAKVDAYERRRDSRTTILSRIASLRGEEPWPGYDELSVEEIRSALARADGDDQLAAHVRSYERSHKDRAGVLAAVEHESGAHA
jgi:ferritin-like metal-binding protein YciE